MGVLSGRPSQACDIHLRMRRRKHRRWRMSARLNDGREFVVVVGEVS
jgi:hypothetical protein